MPPTVSIILLGIGGLVLLVLFLIILNFFNTWLKALLAKAHVSFTNLVAMRLRGVPTSRRSWHWRLRFSRTCWGRIFCKSFAKAPHHCFFAQPLLLLMLLR